MFENIIGQGSVVKTLSRQFRGGEIPRSLLFYGDAYTGKLTAALELARALSCEARTAEWNCPCQSCGLHRVLLHQGTVMLGPRYFLPDLSAAAGTLRRHAKPFARYLYLRAVRKLTRRLDPFLWEGSEQKLRKIGDALSFLEENLDTLHPDRELPEKNKLDEIFDENLKYAEKIIESGLLDSVSIDHIRRVSYWAHTTSVGQGKIIILENADRLSENARNAFLKILEEPPERVYFILLTTNRQGVIDTILSRVRPCYFPPRNPEESALVVEKIFRDNPAPADSLARYFGAWENVDTNELDKLVHAYMELLLRENHPLHASAELDTIITLISQKKMASRFLEKLTDKLRLDLHGRGANAIPLFAHDAYMDIIGKCGRRIELYHQNAGLVLESMYLEMRSLL